MFRKKDNKDLNIDVENSSKNELDETLNLDLIVEDITQEAVLFHPSNFVIGYYEGMTAKGLRDYVNGYVHKYFDAPNTTYYRMMKYNSGYIFEIHDGDYKLSYLKKIIDSFNNGNNVVYVKLQQRIAKVQKNHSKVETFILPENEIIGENIFLIPDKGKMKPIISSGFGMVSLGIAIAFLGVTSLFLSSIFKTILGKEIKSELQTFNIESLPSSYIEKLPKASQTSYVTKVWLDGSSWKKEEKTIKTPEMIIRENNDRSISKIINYQNFTAKCFTKTGSFDQCNDDNIFFDKETFNDNSNIKSVTMKKGLIEIDFKNEDFINYVPNNQNGNLVWKIECSKYEIASICNTPSAIIISEKVGEIVKESKTEKNEIVLPMKKEQIIANDISIKNEKQKVDETKKELVIDNKLKENEKDDIKNVKKEIVKPILNNKTLDSNNEVKNILPTNLNLENLPDNIIVE